MSAITHTDNQKSAFLWHIQLFYFILFLTVQYFSQFGVWLDTEIPLRSHWIVLTRSENNMFEIFFRFFLFTCHSTVSFKLKLSLIKVKDVFFHLCDRKCFKYALEMHGEEAVMQLSVLLN